VLHGDAFIAVNFLCSGEVRLRFLTRLRRIWFSRKDGNCLTAYLVWRVVVLIRWKATPGPKTMALAEFDKIAVNATSGVRRRIFHARMGIVRCQSTCAKAYLKSILEIVNEKIP